MTRSPEETDVVDESQFLNGRGDITVVDDETYVCADPTIDLHAITCLRLNSS